jgi:hydrogenase/urease accessory protein HupE
MLADLQEDADILFRLGRIGVWFEPKFVCIRGGDAQKQRADERKKGNPLDHLERYFRYAVEGLFRYDDHLISIFKPKLKGNVMVCLRAAGTLILFLCFVGALPSLAHEIRPSIATANFVLDGRFEIKIQVNAEVLLAGISPDHSDTVNSPEAQLYADLRALSAVDLEQKFRAFGPHWLAGIEVSFDDARSELQLDRVEVPPIGDLSLPRATTLYVSGQTPSGTSNFHWRYDTSFGSSVLRVKQVGDKKMVAFWLKDGKQSDAIPVTGAPERGVFEVLQQYMVLGFTHILPLGLDHILFVLGLYLLSAHIRPLLIQVTSFTVAHSVTLGLGLYGVVTVSPSIVEPLIAASILFVAVENLVTDRLTPWRPYLVFGFGLIHGLGFAGVLHEIGLERDDFINGLIAFNVGVELGQLAVIVIAFLATGLWFRDRPWYRNRIVRPVSIVIGLAGAYWLVERLM